MQNTYITDNTFICLKLWRLAQEPLYSWPQLYTCLESAWSNCSNGPVIGKLPRLFNFYESVAANHRQQTKSRSVINCGLSRSINSYILFCHTLAVCDPDEVHSSVIYQNGLCRAGAAWDHVQFTHNRKDHTMSNMRWSCRITWLPISWLYMCRTATLTCDHAPSRLYNSHSSTERI